MREEGESKIQNQKEAYEALYAEHDEEVCKIINWGQWHYGTIGSSSQTTKWTTTIEVQ